MKAYVFPNKETGGLGMVIPVDTCGLTIEQIIAKDLPNTPLKLFEFANIEELDAMKWEAVFPELLTE